jgi:hypothetical protein
MIQRTRVLEELGMFSRLLLAVSIMASAVGISFGQATGDAPQSGDEREVREFATKVDNQLRATRDLTPFLSGRLATVLISSVATEDEPPFGIIKHDVALRANANDLKQFYIAMLNVAYLSDLYLYSKISIKKTRIRELPIKDQYPPNVYRLIKSDPFLSKTWHENSEQDSSDNMIRSVRALRHLTAAMQKAANLMRRSFLRHPPEESVQYRENIAYLEPYLKKIRIDEACDSAKSCGPFPLHTQTAFVRLPVVQLMIARINGKLEIVTVGLSIDD